MPLFRFAVVGQLWAGSQPPPGVACAAPQAAAALPAGRLCCPTAGHTSPLPLRCRPNSSIVCPPPGRLPWVFTYNDWSAGTEYDHMVKAAVSSAIKVARLKPYCMFGGSDQSPMYRWLQSRNVTLIQVGRARLASLQVGGHAAGSRAAASWLYERVLMGGCAVWGAVSGACACVLLAQPGSPAARVACPSPTPLSSTSRRGRRLLSRRGGASGRSSRRWAARARCAPAVRPPCGATTLVLGRMQAWSPG